MGQRRWQRRTVVKCSWLLLAAALLASFGQADAAQPGRRPAADNLVFKARLTPHWFNNNSFFWYRNDLRDGVKEFILVEVGPGKRQAAFDHSKLAEGLNTASGAAYVANRLPFDDITFNDGGTKNITFKVNGVVWNCDLTNYVCTAESKGAANAELEESAQIEARALARAEEQERRGLAEQERLESILDDGPSPAAARETEPGALPEMQPGQPRRPARGGPSPDGKWTALIKDNNVFVRDALGKEVQLSKDGTAGNAYGMLEWSPDSKTLVGFRIEPGDNKEVYLVQSSPPGGGRAKLQSRPYPLPGDKFTAYELNLFDVTRNKQTKPKVERIDFGRPILRWRKDGRQFTYEKRDRGHQRFRLIEINVATGDPRDLIDEKTNTFIWSAHTENIGIRPLTWLEKTDEIIYLTERDGWRHLYLHDALDGRQKNLITPGECVVRGVDKVDEEKRQVWFHASGGKPGQDPYFSHYYRVNFDGTDLIALTEGNGDHTISYSPDREYLIDEYERVDLPPVHELRRVQDGRLVCELEKADISLLQASGWSPPEVVVAKGRDGVTDIWGFIVKPKNFDPKKKYPILENIYAGPQGSFVPKRFSSRRFYADMADLGFIVAKVDGMGTANRSKAFHDVCWKNLKDAGFPDRILWHQQVAISNPFYDLSRVGIYGTSAGGQNALGGVLFYPDFYKVAVAACGCHDNRMDKASWNEQWMGYPVGPQYAANSNVDNANRLRGKLLLIVGEMDTNVPPESTLRVADALIRAGKDFDYLVVPNANHGNGGAYGTRRMQEFFVRHLQGG